MANLYRGEFLFEGVLYTFEYSLEQLKYFRDELTLREDDVFIATYGKSGKYSWTEHKQWSSWRLQAFANGTPGTVHTRFYLFYNIMSS